MQLSIYLYSGQECANEESKYNLSDIGEYNTVRKTLENPARAPPFQSFKLQNNKAFYEEHQFNLYTNTITNTNTYKNAEINTKIQEYKNTATALVSIFQIAKQQQQSVSVGLPP